MNEKVKYKPKVKLALDTWVKLARATATFSRRVKEDVRGYGLTVTQLGIIEALTHLGPMTISTLCKKLLLTGGNMTLVLDNMEKKKLIRRVYDEKDRRSIYIHLTAKGERAFSEYFIKHANFVTKLFGVLTVEEQKQLGKLLKKLGKNI